MCILSFKQISVMIFARREWWMVSMNGAAAEKSFPVSCFACLSIYMYRNNLMLGILVLFVKQFVGYFVCQTEVLNGLPLRYRFRFVTDEQMLKIAAAIYAYCVWGYSRGCRFYIWARRHCG